MIEIWIAVIAVIIAGGLGTLVGVGLMSALIAAARADAAMEGRK